MLDPWELSKEPKAPGTWMRSIFGSAREHRRFGGACEFLVPEGESRGVGGRVLLPVDRIITRPPATLVVRVTCWRKRCRATDTPRRWRETERASTAAASDPLGDDHDVRESGALRRTPQRPRLQTLGVL